MTEPDPTKPKIIVDEDWKSQVQSEKEAAKNKPDNEEPEADAMPVPAASFSLLITTLATQALAAMGQLPAPDQDKLTVNLDMAKHCIDTLGVLEEKTKGNLTTDEKSLLAGFLHELRMTFVMVQNKVQSQKAEDKS